jgi:hypothetical protein
MTKVVNKGELRKEKGDFLLSLLRTSLREDKRHLGNDRKLRLLLRQYFMH